MNTCATCKWWTPPGGVQDYYLAGATPPSGCDTFGCCQRTRIEHFEAADPATIALAADGEGNNNCVLMTSPDFGCVQWQEQ